ncbi:MAG TPA: methylated-DNA--[protein]-cysteine S-methyltransferase [Tepidiformaceae bacterium]|nr:methylated-DNA--[protein]-cysteine S-methyltransferase [Tepidiformaceae bacterium]
MPERRNETFYERVYAFVGQVPSGSVVTYGQVALELGAPAAARAVGYALYFMPKPSDIPWWRVINAHGAISYKGRGSSADQQRELLEGEGLRFDANGRVDLKSVRWWPASG